jgi:hypothetical protein
VPTPEQIQELRDAARELRTTFRRSTDQELQRTTIQAPPAPATPGTPAAAPSPDVIVTGPRGPQTYVGVRPFEFDTGPKQLPREAMFISIAFFITVAAVIIGLPLARAFARRMDRRTATQIPPEVSNQLAQLGQAVDAIALEVERISEGQRFTTRLLSEQRDAARQTLPSAP